MVVFTAILILKTMAVLISLIYVSHFHQPSYTTIGELLQLAVQHPEITRGLTEEGLKDGPLIVPLSRTEPALRAVKRKLPWWRLMLISDWVCYGFQLFSLGAVILSIYEAVITYFPIYDTHNIFHNQGFGTPQRPLWTYRIDAPTNPTTSSELTFLVFMANSIQVWLAICVFCANNHVTRAWLEEDWRGYYMKRQKPRISWDTVSDRTGLRSSRKLSPLPYVATGLQLGAGAVAHWIASQAFFVVEAVQKRTNGFVGSNIIFYITHSPEVIGIGGVCLFVFILTMSVHMCWGRWTVMPVMNGSVRVVLASCIQLTDFPDEGIAWGKISDEEGTKLVGFAANVDVLTPGNYGQVVVTGNGRTTKRRWFGRT